MHTKETKEFRDEIILIVLVGISIFLCIKLDLFDLFNQYSRKYEYLEVDEWFISLLPISIITIWYALRKISKNNILSKKILEINLKDSTTSLPNRIAFRKAYEQHKTSQSFLFIINIVNFKDINHSFGIALGDKMIHEIALKLQNVVGDIAQQKLYRLYGDEFAFFYNGDKKSSNALAHSIKTNFEKNTIQLDEDIDIQIDIAISYSNTQPKFQTVLIAMQDIRQSTDKTILLYEKDLNFEKESKQNLEVLKLLKEAREKNLFIPFYQPIIDNKTQKIAKYETLIRIKKDGEIISPFYFLDLSKKYKYYYHITRAVIEKSFEVFKDRDESFSINLSSMDISNDAVLKYLFDIIQNNKETASRMIVELVESENIDFDKKLLAFREKLKTYNIKLAIDDFGSGYSNLVNILQLQPDFIKIDGSLVKELQHDPKSYSLVETILVFAKKNNIQTIAEFVSTKETFEIVQKLGIDFSQGYYFAPPQIKP